MENSRLYRNPHYRKILLHSLHRATHSETALKYATQTIPPLIPSFLTVHSSMYVLSDVAYLHKNFARLNLPYRPMLWAAIRTQVGTECYESISCTYHRVSRDVSRLVTKEIYVKSRQFLRLVAFILTLSAQTMECPIDHIREVISSTISLCYFKNFVHSFIFSLVKIFHFSPLTRRYGVLTLWAFV